MPLVISLTIISMAHGSDSLKVRMARAKQFRRPLFPFIAALTVQIALGPSSSPTPATTDRVSLFPKLHARDNLTYLLQYRVQKNVKAESRVVTPSAPQDARTDAQWILHLEVLDVRPQGDRAAIHARAQFQSVDSATSVKPPPTGQAVSAAPSLGQDSKVVEFTILPDGHAQSVTGLDALFPEQREAWQQWLRQFAIAAVFPLGGVKRGQTWKSTEPEQAPSPIDRLQWEKTVTYVRDEPCSPAPFGETSSVNAQESPAATCAVILTKATLKQKSPPKDTTPADYKLHELRTTGTATGANETISYIALRTGLITRVTEDAKQFMDVIIAKTDGTNQVHYNVDAISHTEVLLLAIPPVTTRTFPKP